MLREELQRIDADRLSAGAAAADAPTRNGRWSSGCWRCRSGSDPVELLLADESVEEVVATRFDLVFVYRSDGTVEQLDERLWAIRGGAGRVAGAPGPHRGADGAPVQRARSRCW